MAKERRWDFFFLFDLPVVDIISCKTIVFDCLLECTMLIIWVIGVGHDTLRYFHGIAREMIGYNRRAQRQRAYSFFLAPSEKLEELVFLFFSFFCARVILVNRLSKQDGGRILCRHSSLLNSIKSTCGSSGFIWTLELKRDPY